MSVIFICSLLAYFGRGHVDAGDCDPPSAGLGSYEDMTPCEFSALLVHPDISCGDHLTLAKSSSLPRLTFPEAKDDMFYHLFMVDPDAPSRQDPHKKYWLHWAVFNVQKTKNGSWSGGKLGIDYEGPTPPEETGIHRYQVLLFETDNEIGEDQYSERGSVNFEKLVKVRSLCDKLVAAFEFLASNADSEYVKPPMKKKATTEDPAPESSLEVLKVQSWVLLTLNLLAFYMAV